MKHSPIKIMNKHYDFVNAIGEKVTVNPIPILNDPKTAKPVMRIHNDTKDKWKRKFQVVDANGHVDWNGVTEIDTENYRSMPEVTLNGNLWTLTAIEGIKAHRVRRTKAQIEADNAREEAESMAEETTVDATAEVTVDATADAEVTVEAQPVQSEVTVEA